MICAQGVSSSDMTRGVDQLGICGQNSTCQSLGGAGGGRIHPAVRLAFDVNVVIDVVRMLYLCC
jgi:hypothetical protein